MFTDLRFVVRTLARNRGFMWVTVLTLALGIGSAASIFSVTDWILFRATKYPADLALVLTVVGVFRCSLYLAVGATRRDFLQLVMRRGLLLALTGVLGLGGAIALTRYLQSLLFETSAQDPRVLAAVGAVLLVPSIFACVLPARRATKVDITELLRSE